MWGKITMPERLMTDLETLKCLKYLALNVSGMGLFPNTFVIFCV